MASEQMRTDVLEPGGAAALRSRRRFRPLYLARRHKLAAFAVVILAMMIIIAIFAPVLTPHDPAEADGRIRLESPSLTHPFGTDGFGRDVMTRVFYGARISLQVGGIAVLVAVFIGVPLGLVSGYAGGFTDAFIMRLVDAVLAFPGLLLALALVLALGPSIFNLMLALGIGVAPVYARLVRSQVLSLKERDFVLAARASGATDARIMFGHVLPNTYSSIIVASTLTMGVAILTEATLSFLGLGVRPPTPTWGGMLNEAGDLIYQSPYLMFFPGVAIFLATLSLNLLGDGLRDALDPNLRNRV